MYPPQTHRRSILALAVAASIPAALAFSLCSPCTAQTLFHTNPTRYVVCDHGSGDFKGTLPGRLAAGSTTVVVHPDRKGDFAIHACRAQLLWNGGYLTVASDAAKVDIDVMGADLGLGSLVVALQVQPSDTDPHIEYRIYSLSAPSKLLRTITGEDWFSAADTRLDGSVEIWTTDAVAIHSLADAEGLPRSAFDHPPSAVLRFEKGKLIDVSSEFQPYFDRQIELLRAQLDPAQLELFKQSDGRPSSDDPRDLVAVEVRVLEIVWNYLASGREAQAWDALAAMWPPSDLARIRADITEAQSHGLRSQVDGVSHQPPPSHPKHSVVYRHIPPSGVELPPEVRDILADTAPERIVLKTLPPRNPAHWDEDREMEVLIDEAGKVRSASMKGKGLPGEPDSDWLEAAAGWKYIPAYKDGHPVAFRWKEHIRRKR